MSSEQAPATDGKQLANSTKSDTPANQPSLFEEAAKTALKSGVAVASTAAHTGRVIVDTAIGVGEAIAYSAARTGKTAVDTASEIGEVISNTAALTGKAIVDTTTGISEIVAKQTYQLIEQSTQKAGEAVSVVGDNWLLRKTSGWFKLDWLFGAVDQVELDKAEAAVRKLQQEYPNESPSQIAHRIMVDKAVQVGGIGLVSSLVPGVALALLAIDLVATTRLQAEMVYQIAVAYGLDLKHPARRGEVLGIFGLALSGEQAVKVGLGLLRNIPLAGAVIGASSNAVMLYSLGYAACRFYEAKLNSSTAEEMTLEELKEESDSYLQVAIAQQKVMDQILVHMILASHPEKSWEDILPELQSLKLSPNSLETIAENIKSPQPLDTLLDQLNLDYAIPLLAQCYRMTQTDGVTTVAEAEVMNKIAGKFNIDSNAIKEMVQRDR